VIDDENYLHLLHCLIPPPQKKQKVPFFFHFVKINNEIFSEEFVAVGMGKFYEFPDPKNAPNVGNGMHLRQGLAKGVKIIKNDGTMGGGNGNGRPPKPKAAVVLDSSTQYLRNNPFYWFLAKVSAFFIPQTLVHTVLEILPRNPQMSDFTPQSEVQKLIKDLRVEVNYRKQRTFELGKFTEQPIRDI
jgi:hypothetical protein